MSVRTVAGSLSAPKVRRSLFRILRSNLLCSMATVDPRGRAHIHTAYFAFGEDLAFYFYSYPDSRHARHLRHNASMAVTVFDSGQVWGGSDRGLQLKGRCHPVRGPRAEVAAKAYARRFPGFRAWVRSLERVDGRFELQPFRFAPTDVTLFDERVFGSGRFVRIAVPRTTKPPAERPKALDERGP
jgi:uncharacterized protein YhbP (UPF0306 family)